MKKPRSRGHGDRSGWRCGGVFEFMEAAFDAIASFVEVVVAGMSTLVVRFEGMTTCLPAWEIKARGVLLS